MSQAPQDSNPCSEQDRQVLYSLNREPNAIRWPTSLSDCGSATRSHIVAYLCDFTRQTTPQHACLDLHANADHLHLALRACMWFRSCMILREKILIGPGTCSCRDSTTEVCQADVYDRGQAYCCAKQKTVRRVRCTVHLGLSPLTEDKADHALIEA